MPQVKCTSALKRFFPDLGSSSVEGSTIMMLLKNLDSQHPGLLNYILDDQKNLRKHVNIFINGHILHDRNNLTQKVKENEEVYIIQALSGG